MFTRQHYKAIAEIIKNRLYYNDLSDSEYRGIVNDLADYFAKDNLRFDREKFLAACELL